jgi:hypothetical protein
MRWLCLGQENAKIFGEPCEHVQTLQGSYWWFLCSASVNVRLWRLGEYRNNDTQLPHLIDPDWIISQLGMTVVSIGHKRTKGWATIDLAKVNFYCWTHGTLTRVNIVIDIWYKTKKVCNGWLQVLLHYANSALHPHPPQFSSPLLSSPLLSSPPLSSPPLSCFRCHSSSTFKYV